MTQVKILYVRNLMLSTREQSLERLFTDAVADKASSTDTAVNVIERVKKIRDYAFVHFHDRDVALHAMHRLNGLLLSFTFNYYCFKLCGTTLRFLLAESLKRHLHTRCTLRCVAWRATSDSNRNRPFPLGNATRAPENPGKPADFQAHKPGFV